MKIIMQNAVKPGSNDRRVEVFNYETNPDWKIVDAKSSLCSKACLAANLCLETYYKGQNVIDKAVAIDSFGVFLIGMDISSVKELLNYTFTDQSFTFNVKVNFQKDQSNNEYIKTIITISGQTAPGDARTFICEVSPGIDNPTVEIPIIDYSFTLNNDSPSMKMRTNVFYICDNAGEGVEFGYDNGNRRVYDADGLLDFTDDVMEGHCIDFFKDNLIDQQIKINELAEEVSKLLNETSSHFVAR